jgi:hypothetical protein
VAGESALDAAACLYGGLAGGKQPLVPVWRWSSSKNATPLTAATG